MAKVIGPLHSISASGKFGDAMVFDIRGYVKAFKKPSNPKTAPQGNQRQKMAMAQQGVSKIGANKEADIAAVAPVSYRWNSYLTGLTLNAPNLTAAGTAWAALSGAEQSAWNTEATSNGFTTVDIDYASDPALTAGRIAFVLAHTLNANSLGGAVATPDGTNAAAWLTEITS